MRTRASEQDRLDISATDRLAWKELMRDSFFPTWKDDTGGEELDSPDEMQMKDPLGIQIWRLYSKTKTQLPNQERMENLTWRMMAMCLRKRRRDEATQLCRQNNTTASTRIQRSRKSSEQHADRPDAIGLDHFIFFHDVATPAILGMSPSSHLRKKDEKSTADSPGYPLDSSHPSGVPHHNNRPRTPFQLDAFTIDRGPIITSASPFQQSLSFSPSNPLLLYHRPFSAGSNNASIPSSLNSTDYYSPSGSTHPSAVSALQPIPDNEQMFGMDMRHQRSPPFSRRPPTRSNSIVPQYTYNANGVSMFTAVTSAGPSTSFPSPKPFGMVQHINDTQEFPSDHPMPSPGLHMGYGNMFSFGGDSDNKDEEGVTFADRTVSTKVLSPVMQIEFLNVTMREAYL